MEEIFAALFWLAFIGSWVWGFVLVIRHRRSPNRHVQRNNGTPRLAGHVLGHAGSISELGTHHLCDPEFDPNGTPPGWAPVGDWIELDRQAAADSAKAHDEMMDQMLR